MEEYEDIPAADLRASAEYLGVWDYLHDRTLSSRLENGTYHTSRCRDLVDPKTPDEIRELWELTGTWCACLVAQYGNFTEKFPLSPAGKFLQMSFLHHYVTRKSETLPTDLVAWSSLWMLSGGILSLEIRALESPPKHYQWDQELLNLFIQTSKRLQVELARVSRALSAISTPAYRETLLARQEEFFPRSPVPGDDTEVLLAAHQIDLNEYAGSDNARDLLGVSAVEWSGDPLGVNFYRLPRWVADLFRECTGHNYLQIVPWEENLSLETVRGLWDPAGESDMRHLTHAVQAARLV